MLSNILNPYEKYEVVGKYLNLSGSSFFTLFGAIIICKNKKEGLSKLKIILEKQYAYKSEEIYQNFDRVYTGTGTYYTLKSVEDFKIR
jgi:hypothetical protein